MTINQKWHCGSSVLVSDKDRNYVDIFK